MNIIVIFLLVLGLLFFTVGTIGILRLPDFYSRLHPAGKLDTMGVLLAMGGLALYNLHALSLGTVITSLKIALIVVFVFVTSPTATHAILDAGYRAGLQPWTKPGRRG